jgi:hypothetical protein
MVKLASQPEKQGEAIQAILVLQRNIFTESKKIYI